MKAKVCSICGERNGHYWDCPKAYKNKDGKRNAKNRHRDNMRSPDMMFFYNG